jgi:glycosyltransferase involved in cell wall biosynthesis
MKFSLIICTYQRPKALIKLLTSVQKQLKYPNEILVIDGSIDFKTKQILEKKSYKNLKYFLVPETTRGLTKQRNFGISKVSSEVDVVCFLDDDTVLTPSYFHELIKTFENNNLIAGVGGVSVNENRWQKIDKNKNYHSKKYYLFEGYAYKEGLRNVVRNYLGLQSNLLPGRMPKFSNGRTCGYPLNGKTYDVDLLIGMSFSFRKDIFNYIKFSEYFEGYGLYEDADFSIRALQFGKNVINTKVQLNHYHNQEGRPNKFKYGKMVIKNGWYVWRVANPNPSLKTRFKWHLITILLTLIRFSNILTTSKKKESLTEAIGRSVAWCQLIFSKPKIY